jgi:hypothetical protein
MYNCHISAPPPPHFHFLQPLFLLLNAELMEREKVYWLSKYTTAIPFPTSTHPFFFNLCRRVERDGNCFCFVVVVVVFYFTDNVRKMPQCKRNTWEPRLGGRVVTSD